ncbi:MAG: winged helix-turn-helix transcriptional regulator, partial [Deltaproteobacteria bacterium]|nr:winged helix-turn-helix transcriptional regulator [Deltaproteobacteria bacterium]
RDGLVLRQATADVPPRVEYQLTAMGQEVYAHFIALVRWAERAVDAGGALGAEAAVWLLVLDGDALARVGAGIESTLRSDAIDARHVRHAIYAAMIRHKSAPSAALSDAARFAWRAAVRDRALFGEPSLSHLGDLETLARDRTLHVDRPVIVPLSRTKLDRLAAPLVVGPSTAGAFEVRDAAVLPDRRVLVALGEAGLRILSAEGRTIASFDVPTDALVLSDEGTRALSISRRGTLAVVHRIDAAQRRVGDRFEILGLEGFARTFDGERWAVVIEGVGQVLDVAEDRPRSLFRVKDARVVHVDRSLGFVSFVASSAPMPSAPSGLERLRFEERGLVLRERRALPERFGMEGRLYGIACFEPEPMHVMMTHGTYFLTEGLTAYPGSRERQGRPKGPDSLVMAAAWVALLVEHASPIHDEPRVVTDVVVLDRAEQRERLIVTIDDGAGPAVREVGLRLQSRRGEPPLLVLFDSRGRVIAVELDEGRVLVDLGVR